MARSSDTSDTTLTRTVHRILLGFVILVCIVLLVLWRIDNPRLERLRMSVIDAFAPSMRWVGGPIDFAWTQVRDYRKYVDVYEHNQTLLREIQLLKIYRDQVRVLEEENAQLRALNNVRIARRTTFVTGDVFADSGGPFVESALVNVGRRDGIRDGAAAVDGSGLVGRVVGVGERASRLLLLTDFSSRVPVIVQPGGRRAILAGDGTIAPKLEFLDANDTVRPNDRVETSGDGGVFPPDLPVGQVIVTSGGTPRASLFADYAGLKFVRLLRYNPDTSIDQPGDLVLPDRDTSAVSRPDLAGTASN